MSLPDPHLPCDPLWPGLPKLAAPRWIKRVLAISKTRLSDDEIRKDINDRVRAALRPDPSGVG